MQSTPYLPDTWQAEQLPPGILVRDMRPQNPPIMVSVKRGRVGVEKALKGGAIGVLGSDACLFYIIYIITACILLFMAFYG